MRNILLTIKDALLILPLACGVGAFAISMIDWQVLKKDIKKCFKFLGRKWWKKIREFFI